MEQQLPQQAEQQQQQSPSFEDCLKLLRGERDEQRLLGLLLAPKFCKNDDVASISRVYRAVGPEFLDRLLRTGMREGGSKDNRDAYLQLSVSVLASFCRVPEIASSEDMLSKVPLVLKIMSKRLGNSFTEECYEFLLLVTNGHEDGVPTLYKSGGMSVLAHHMSTLPEGSQSLECATRLVQLMTIKLPLETITNEYSSELAIMVTVIAKQFALKHDGTKFEALHLLSTILSSKHSAAVHAVLCSMMNDNWSDFIRLGVVAVLQNRVGPAQKLQALVLADSTISIVGEDWFIGRMTLAGLQDPFPVDRCMLLLLETSRVEVSVLLNELAYLKFEAPKNVSSTYESIILKQSNLAVAFSLVERIIKLISNIEGDEDSLIKESTFIKVISTLNETINVVLEYLQDTKDHGESKGNDLLASVRVVGSYLAEVPLASKEKVLELLGYMLSIEGEDEPSPSSSVCFLLPMLCQITMESYGCKALAASGGYTAVVECLLKLILPDCLISDDNSSIFLACDTVMNFLLKKDEIQVPINDACFVCLLGALALWAGGTSESSVIMMAASICSLILDSTSEGALLQHPSFDSTDLSRLSQLIAKSLTLCGEGVISNHAKADADLHQIIMSGYTRWADRFPHIREAVEREV